MNTTLIIITLVVVLILALVIFYMCLHNRINDTVIRYCEAESLIDSNLRNKYDLLERAIGILKGKKIILDDSFKELIKIKLKRISNFDFDRILASSYNELLSIYNDNKKVSKEEELVNIIKEIDILDEELTNLRDYYNKNITIYNKMVKKFPTLIVAKINHYFEKPFYDLKDMTDDNYEDFKV